MNIRQVVQSNILNLKTKIFVRQQQVKHSFNNIYNYFNHLYFSLQEIKSSRKERINSLAFLSHHRRCRSA
jgi:hypothetical protein